MMRRFLTALILPSVLMALAMAQDVRFRPVDVVIDTGGKPLAAYQFELVYEREIVKLVGVEGGEGLFEPAPYYDPRGLEAGRIVIAAFTTEISPPAGRTRVARIHLAHTGDAVPELNASLVLAATTEGVRIDATLELVFDPGEER